MASRLFPSLADGYGRCILGDWSVCRSNGYSHHCDVDRRCGQLERWDEMVDQSGLPQQRHAAWATYSAIVDLPSTAAYTVNLSGTAVTWTRSWSTRQTPRYNS